jgi:guanine nucleotide-binding protein subunit alpha
LAGKLATTESDVETDDAFSDPDVQSAMKELWEDKGVQQAVSRGHEFALHDNLH